MRNWFHKHYSLVCSVALLFVLIAWTAFWNNSSNVMADVSVSEADTAKDTESDVSQVTQNSIEATSDDVSDSISLKSEVEVNETDVNPTENIQTIDVAELDCDPKSEIPLGDCNEGEGDIDYSVFEPVGNDVEASDAEEPDEDNNQDNDQDNEAPAVTEPVEFRFEYCLANVNEKLNVRSGPGEDFDVIAGMLPNSYALILEREGEWTRIKSGDVVGYASSKYLLFDMDAVERLERLNVLYVRINANTVNVRSAANTDSKVLRQATLGQKYIYLPEKDVDGWHCVQYSETDVAYISKQYSDIFIDLKVASPIL